DLAPIGPDDAGVLMAMGDVFGGVSVYVQSGRLTFAVSALESVSRAALPEGAHLGSSYVRAAFTLRDDGSAVMAIACESAPEPVTADVPWAPRLRFFMGTAQCGRDQDAPVVSAYEGSFPYS